MKIKSVLSLSNLKTLEDLVRYVSQFADAVSLVVNGRIEIQDNLFVSSVTADFTAPNTTVGVAHDLGRVPVGYLVTGLGSALIVFDGTTTNTNSTLYVQASATGSARLLVY